MGTGKGMIEWTESLETAIAMDPMDIADTDTITIIMTVDVRDDTMIDTETDTEIDTVTLGAIALIIGRWTLGVIPGMTTNPKARKHHNHRPRKCSHLTPAK